jgi:hypothetical protein
MTDRKKTARAEVIEWLYEAHRHSQINSQSDRDAWVNAWLAVLDLVVTQVVDLSPIPVKEKLQPIPARPVIDSLPKLHAARAKLVELQALERRLRAIPYNKQEARHDAELSATRHEIACLNVDIKIASAMERTTHAG